MTITNRGVVRIESWCADVDMAQVRRLDAGLRAVLAMIGRGNPLADAMKTVINAFRGARFELAGVTLHRIFFWSYRNSEDVRARLVIPMQRVLGAGLSFLCVRPRAHGWYVLEPIRIDGEVVFPGVDVMHRDQGVSYSSLRLPERLVGPGEHALAFHIYGTRDDEAVLYWIDVLGISKGPGRSYVESLASGQRGPTIVSHSIQSGR